MKLLKLYVCVICLYNVTKAQTHVGITQLAMWNTLEHSINPESIWSLYSFPSTLVYANSLQIAAASNYMYGISDITNATFCAGKSTKQGAFGTSISYTGNDIIQIPSISLHYAKILYKTVSCAVSCEYIQNRNQEQVQSHYTLIPQLSTTYKPTKDIITGFSIQKIIYNTYKNNKPIQNLQIGATYFGIPKSSISVRLQKNQSTHVQTSLGVDYKLHKSIQAHAVVSNRYTPFSVGLDYSLFHVTCSYTTELHSYLGFSHTLRFLYSL